MSRAAGIHLDVPFEDYIADALADAPSLNAGTADTLIAECPRAAWYGHARLNPAGPGKKTKAQDIGTICHAILLEGDASKVAVIDPQDYPGAKGAIPRGWTTTAIKEARDTARAAGKVPVLKDDFANIEAMVEAAQAFIKGSEIADIWPHSDREATLLWCEPGIWLRSRPDALSKDRLIVVDVKSTTGSANPDAWGRTQIEGHNELQAALGVRGLRALLPGLRADPRYVWLVIEQQAPFLCSLVAPDPAAMALASDKLSAAIDLWRACLKSGKWPGYGNRIAWIAPPAWAMARWEERATAGWERRGSEFTQDELAAGIPL